MNPAAVFPQAAAPRPRCAATGSGARPAPVRR